MPAAVLPAGVLDDAARDEPELLVHLDARIVRQRDAGDHGVEAALGQLVEQRDVERLAEALATRLGRDVDAGLDRPVVRLALAPRAGLRVAEHLAGFLGDEPRIARAIAV